MPNSRFRIPTRYFMQTKIDRPFEVESKFIYNYFTPDEAADEDLVLDDSSPKFTSYVNKDLEGKKYSIDSDGKKIVFVNGKQASGDVLRRISPRFVEVSWNHKVSVPTEKLEETTIKQLDDQNKIIREEDIASFYDSSLRFFDPTLRERVVRKLDIMRHIRLPAGDPHQLSPYTPDGAAERINQLAYESNTPTVTLPFLQEKL